jgi:hypothetical protein
MLHFPMKPSRQELDRLFARRCAGLSVSILGRIVVRSQVHNCPIATAAEVADEECIVLIGRIARTVPALTAAALDALGAIDNPLAARLRRLQFMD